ncbi:MFS transporter [Streptomyces albireticuli]|uniref:MFS transporter n=1 Tax=Streptomyces albireticuli TaxID=1940 RepID=UPI00367DBD38
MSRRNGRGGAGTGMPHRPAVLVLALGAFAVGTDGYVTTGILQSIADDLRVSVSLAGQLVTVFALSYAVSAPVLMTLTANVGRRVMLHGSLGVFLFANVLGALAPGYPTLLTARVLAGASAAVYMNTAVAAATAMTDERHRGRAVAFVVGGLSVATALGVPLGTLVGALGSWRVTLGLIAALAAMGMAALALTLPATPSPPPITMSDRLRVAAEPAVLLAVLANTCAVAGGFTVYTYLAVFARDVTGLSAAGVSGVLFAWGVAAAAGTAVGGRMSDRRGPDRAYLTGVLGVVAAFAALALTALLTRFAEGPATVAFLLATVAWGVLYWIVPGAQIQRVMDRAPAAPTIAVSVSSASSYLGVALGGGLGGATLSLASSPFLPLTGAALLVAAAVLTARQMKEPVVSCAGGHRHGA